MSKTSTNQRAGRRTRPSAPVPRRAKTTPASRRAQRAVARGRRQRRNTTFWIAITLIVVIGVAATVAVASGGSSNSGSPDQLASPALVQKLSTVPADVFSTVGKGSAVSLPTAIDAPTFT